MNCLFWYSIFSVNNFYLYSLLFRISRKSFYRISFGSWIITIWSSAATNFYYKYLINVFIFNINIFNAANDFHLNEKIYEYILKLEWIDEDSIYIFLSHNILPQSCPDSDIRTLVPDSQISPWYKNVRQ